MSDEGTKLGGGTVAEGPFAHVMSPQEYCLARKRFFQHVASVNWQMRLHRAELIRRGALLKICGRWYIHGVKFDAAMLEIGGRASGDEGKAA